MGIDSLIRCSAIKLISKVNESQEIGLVPFVVVHGCFWGMFCNSGLIQEYPIHFNLDRRTSSHYALCSEIYICYKALCHTSAYGIGREGWKQQNMVLTIFMKGRASIGREG